MPASSVNPLSLSDDELDDALLAELQNEDKGSEEGSIEGADPETTNDTDSTEETTDVEETTEESASQEEEDTSEETEEDTVTAAPGTAPEEEEGETTTTDTPAETAPTDAAEIDYKENYEAIFKPFKANGKEMQVDNVEDVRSLMQMGANYNKKMAALKPNLKIMKMLENNDLLDSDRLSYLIDLNKKNPEAIKKLFNESGLDPLDLDNTGKDNYTPTAYDVSDTEVELDHVLSELQSTDSFTKTIDIIGNQWDQVSKDAIAKDPGLIRTLNDHVGTGIYDKVIAVVERERMLGRLQGVSDIQAYEQIGNQINSQGGFASPNTEQKQNTSAGISLTSNVNRAKPVIDPKIRDRKKAAGSTKTAPGAAKEEFNPLGMSDEDFESLATSKYI